MGDRQVNQPLIVLDRKSVSTIRIKEGDAIVVKLPAIPRLNNSEMAQQMVNQVESLLRIVRVKQCAIIVIPAGIDIQSLDDGEMERAGWVRKGEY